MTDDLTAVPGLEERHRRVLALRLGITTYNALAQAGPQEIFSAMSRNRPQPTLDDISEWQAQARRRADRQATDITGWERAVSFVISFERRQADGGTKRRLVAEQTEMEPEQPPTSWPDWHCEGLSHWLQERLGGPEPSPGAEGTRAGTEAPEPEAEAPEPVGARYGARQQGAPGRAKLHLDSVVIVDSSGRVEAVTGGRPTGLDLRGTLPAHIEIRVTGGAVGTELRVALRFREPGRPRWSPQAPITIRSHRTATLELSDAALGRHHARVVAWAPDASAEPNGIDLGDLMIWPAGSR